MSNENNSNGWKVAFALFGVAQVLGLFLLSMIFSRVDRMEARVGEQAEWRRVTEYRVGQIESVTYELGRDMKNAVRTKQ